MVCIIIGLIMENNNNIFYKYIYCLILNLVIFFKIVIYFLIVFFLNWIIWKLIIEDKWSFIILFKFFVISLRVCIDLEC